MIYLLLVAVSLHSRPENSQFLQLLYAQVSNNDCSFLNRILLRILFPTTKQRDRIYRFVSQLAQRDEPKYPLAWLLSFYGVFPLNADALLTLANLKLLNNDPLREVLTICEECIGASDPAKVEGMLSMIGRLLLKHQGIQPSIRFLQHFQQQYPQITMLNQSLGSLFESSHQFQEAEHYYLTCARQQPNHLNWHNLGACYNNLGRFDEAIKCFEQALIFLPNSDDTLFNLSLVYLVKGEYERGWQLYEHRRYCPSLKMNKMATEIPRWQNESLGQASILVVNEQGVGDEIMFASCLPDLRDVSREVQLIAEPRLVSLFKRSFPSIQVFTKDEVNSAMASSYLRPNYLIDIGSLPLHFRHGAIQFPKKTYLTADPELRVYWSSKLSDLGAGLKIGFSWKGGTHKSLQFRRTIPLAHWQELFKIPNTHWINLQYGEERKQLEKIGLANAHGWPESMENFDQMAALVCEVDVVISVQNTLVHLAGALGTSTLALLPTVPEWRYGATGEDMLWYSSVTLARQRDDSTWADVFSQVKDRILEMSGVRNG